LSIFTISEKTCRGSRDAARAARRKLPEYADELAAFHQAFAPELRTLVGSLPISPRMRVLDVACGDGFYTELFAERLISPGAVTGLDANAACLALARKRLAGRDWQCGVELVAGPLERAPLPAGSFDFVWCAQSLFTLPDPVRALEQMGASVRPGGFVAVLENDTLHQLLLPWPYDLELALRTAELEVISNGEESCDKFYIGRRLPEIFAAAGLEPLSGTTQAIDRRAPLDPSLRAFLEAHLSRLVQRVAPRLDPRRAREIGDLFDPENDASLWRQPFASLTWLNRLQWARRPD